MGFATPDKDAAQGFHLRLIMTNFLVPFNCTFAELGRKPGVAAIWVAISGGSETGERARSLLGGWARVVTHKLAAD